MKEGLYINNNLVIINFDLAYSSNTKDLLNSIYFKEITEKYINHLKEENPNLYKYLLNENTTSDALYEILKTLRMLLVVKPEEIDNHYLKNKNLFLEFVEGFHDYWMSYRRFSITRTRFSRKTEQHFVLQDSSFNSLLRSFYRDIEQNLSGEKNNIYRQLQTGTNASILVYQLKKFFLSDKYNKLSNILIIKSVMLRTPMIISTNSNKREGTFKETYTNPIISFDEDENSWIGYPAKVGNLFFMIYFHRDYIYNGVSLANLFELASSNIAHSKPDGILLFGNTKQDENLFYHDKEEDLWVGTIGYNVKSEYFGYMKKMILTLHNLKVMEKGWLPIHGSLVNVYLKNGEKKGLLLVGDSGAGKSESIEALQNLENDIIKHIEIVFDDMGSLHIEDGVPYAQGTEIGAFLRLDDLSPGTPYENIDRSIFFNPNKSNSRLIIKTTNHNIISKNHSVDLLCYLNNYDEKEGMYEFKDIEEAKKVFVRGKRMSKGTTQEIGISKTYFANPFGPMQKKELCNDLINKIFKSLRVNGTYIGEIYTQLGLNTKEEKPLNTIAKKLLKFLQRE
ncbi:MAG: hypothetical protein LBT66_09470 [Methanobrevibacter sp.]|jgi:energy-coupling factor transporter ATP-binding protein EcfA2|nr:hypothetical protein [Candidatus Methanovirga meridionalis]